MKPTDCPVERKGLSQRSALWWKMLKAEFLLAGTRMVLIHFQVNLHHIHKEEGFFCNITEASTEISNVFEGFDVPHIDPGIFHLYPAPI